MHKSRDPDIQALIAAAGGLFTPRQLVTEQARKLLEKLRDFPCNDGLDPLKRIKIIASIAGFDVQAMEAQAATSEKRDAVLVQTHGRRKGRVLYNPARPLGRIVFSIAHEIAHGFFPVTEGGVRYRTATMDCSLLSRELEKLCDHGAAELVMPEDDFRAASKHLAFDFGSVEQLRSQFGTSYEATFYRFVETRDFPCAGGLAKFRLKPSEERGHRNIPEQLRMFGGAARATIAEPVPRYRVQAFSRSGGFPPAAHIPKHKSLPGTSCVYRVALASGSCTGSEHLPFLGGGTCVGQMQARSSPYQDPLSDVEHPDVMFMFRLLRSASGLN
jgi:Zn-dependent peptidase ImmA (M78 family)